MLPGSVELGQCGRTIAELGPLRVCAGRPGWKRILFLPGDAKHPLRCHTHMGKVYRARLRHLRGYFGTHSGKNAPCGRRRVRESISILTDLHLSSKPFRIRQALQATKNDVVLLLGDSASDGLQEQFEALETCIDDLIPGKVILPVIGNHDILHSRKADGDGCRNYATFQTRSLQNAEKRGMSFERDPDSLAWATTIGTLDVIGLQCVISERRFLFPERKQLEWLENRLTAHRDSAWHLILCHAPLISHNPLRSDGQPYLDKDRQLQALIDRIGHCIFLSGHTHISPNTMKSSAEWDGLRNNLYLNCGSVVDTTTEHDESLMSRDWKDGCVTEITLSSDIIEIVTKSIRTGIYFPRGYYRFTMTDNAE